MNHQNLYTGIAYMYDLGLYLNGYRRAVSYIARQLPFHPKRDLRVLDAGCGTGLYSIAILRQFPNATLVACDLNPDMVEKMKNNLVKQGLESRAKVFVGNVLEPMPDESEGSFDMIISGGVLEYVEISKAISNFSRYLKKGGYWLNSPVKNNICGRVIGWWMKFVPYARRKNISAFVEGEFELEKEMAIPWYYFPICMVKEAHLFKKQS